MRCDGPCKACFARSVSTILSVMVDPNLTILRCGVSICHRKTCAFIVVRAILLATMRRIETNKISKGDYGKVFKRRS